MTPSLGCQVGPPTSCTSLLFFDESFAVTPSGSSNFTQTSSTSGGGGIGFGSVLGGVGGLLTGLGAVTGPGALFGGSHPSFKDIEGDVDVDAILAAVAATPVKRWRYKGDDREHVGIMADAAAENTGVGDGVTLHMIDMVGILWAAVQAQQAEIESLKNG